MSEERIHFLLDLYINHSPSEGEVRELFALLEAADGSPAVRSQIGQLWAQYDVELQSVPVKSTPKINMFTLRAVAARNLRGDELVKKNGGAI